MSMMLCSYCSELVDTDEFPDSLYVAGHDGKCVCDYCREARNLRLEDDSTQQTDYLRGLA